MADGGIGVLCMAYGSPSDESDIERYFTHIRGGRPPSEAALQELRERYRAVGHSPLAEITRRQAAALEARSGIPCFVGFKHAPPFIAGGAAEAETAGITRLVGLPLAPHYADMSLGAYEKTLRETWHDELIFVRGFHDHPAFTEAVRNLLRGSLARFDAQRVLFTAHSLPARIIDGGDDYPGKLLESCRLVADGMDIPGWEFAFQSASATGEPWLGPDLLQAIARSGAKRVLICPIGFVADHLEILYDLDIEAQQFARDHGVELRRTPSFNDAPEFVAVLASIVEDAIEEAGWAPTAVVTSTAKP